MVDRIGFAYQHQHWGMTAWKNVLFSDEKSSVIDKTGTVWVHRPAGKPTSMCIRDEEAEDLPLVYGVGCRQKVQAS